MKIYPLFLLFLWLMCFFASVLITIVLNDGTLNWVWVGGAKFIEFVVVMVFFNRYENSINNKTVGKWSS